MTKSGSIFIKKLLSTTLAAVTAITITSLTVDKAVKDSKTASFNAEETHIVGNNETIWSIAKDNLDKSGLNDVNEYAFYIRKANPDLGKMIYQGQEIIVPVKNS